MSGEKEEKTLAQEMFAGGKLLLERPEGMEFDEYKLLQYRQNRIIKKLFAKEPFYKQRRTRRKSKTI